MKKPQTQPTKHVARSAPVADVEFDAKHVDSPLCACKACNDAWLAKRDKPLSKKHMYEVKQTMNPERLAHYAPKFAHHGLALRVRGTEWHVSLIKSPDDAPITTAFDVDLERLLTQLERGCQFTQLDLTFHATSSTVVRSTAGGNLTGGPWCVMCGEPGGLPSPNMVGGAKLLGLRLFFEPTDARINAARLHPGRCRKRLRQLLDTAAEQSQLRRDARAAGFVP